MYVCMYIHMVQLISNLSISMLPVIAKLHGMPSCETMLLLLYIHCSIRPRHTRQDALFQNMDDR